MKGTPVPMERWPAYRHYEATGASYGAKIRLRQLRETPHSVVIECVVTPENNIHAPHVSKSTLAKFLCVGGPNAGQRFTSLEVPEGYTQFNSAVRTTRTRWRRADPKAPAHSMIYVHDSVL